MLSCIIQQNILFDLGNGHPPQTAKRGRKKANSLIRNRREFDGMITANLPSTGSATRRNNANTNAMFLAYNLQPVIEIVDLTNNTSR